MKNIFFILICILLKNNIQSQNYNREYPGDIFEEKYHPADSFSVQKRIINLKDIHITLVLLHHDYKKDRPNDFQLWAGQQGKNGLIKSKYLGWFEDETESAFRLPEKTINDSLFCIHAATEYSGTFFFVSKSGKWFEMTGSYLYFDPMKNHLITDTPGECTGCNIATCDLKNWEIAIQERAEEWSQKIYDANLKNLFEEHYLLKW